MVERWRVFRDADVTPPGEGGHPVEPLPGFHWREWLAEMAGTALLFGVGFAVVAALVSPRSPLADDVASVRFLLVGLNFGILSAVIAVSPLGRRSGAHLNPAVTIGFWLRGDVHRHDLAGYLAAQFLGALLGTATFAVALGSWAESIRHARTSAAPVGSVAGVAIEAALTFGLLVTVLVSLGSMRLVRRTPLVVAAVLTVLIWLGSPPTGASLNPARSLAPALIERDLTGIWIYFAGPILGAATAVAVLSLAQPVRGPLTAKLFHDVRYRSTMRCRLPSGAD
jgi:aquaporin Z